MSAAAAIDRALGEHHFPAERARLLVARVEILLAGGDVTTTDYAFKPPAGAKQINLDELKAMKNMGELPSHFIMGGK